MGNPYELRLARKSDRGHIFELIRLASEWLASKGTDQWQEPWPGRRARDARIRAAIEAGKTWILMDDGVAVGTITADWQSDPAPGLPVLWDAGQRAVRAVYAHRMTVRREPRYQGRGIGRQMLDAVGNLGVAAYGAEWLRLDAWTTNYDLHTYYKGLGFQALGTYGRDVIDCPSGALFQKPAESFAGTSPAFAVNDVDAAIWRARANDAHTRPQTGRNPTLTMATAGR